MDLTMKTRLIKFSRLSVMIGSALYLISCTNINFKEPVTTYASAMSASTTVVTDYYDSQNELARRFYFTQLKYDRTRNVQTVDESGAKTPVYLRYSAEGIKARRDALGLISAYGNKLAVLAGADFPDRISNSSVAIMTGYENLSQAFSELKGKEATYKAEFSKETKNLVAATTKMYEERERNKALTAAIVEGYPASNKILATFQKDMNLFADMDRARQSTQFSQLACVYNEDVKVKAGQKLAKGELSCNGSDTLPAPLSEPQRLELLSQVQSTAVLYEKSVINRPDDVVAAMIQANDALYAYASNPEGDNSLIALNAALETFNARIKPFVDYYVSLQ